MTAAAAAAATSGAAASHVQDGVGVDVCVVWQRAPSLLLLLLLDGLHGTRRSISGHVTRRIGSCGATGSGRTGSQLGDVEVLQPCTCIYMLLHPLLPSRCNKHYSFRQRTHGGSMLGRGGTKFDFRPGSAPDPAGGAYSALSDPLDVFKGAYF